DMEMLAGALLDAVASKDAEAKEAWRAKGSTFFQRRGRKAGRTAGGNGDSAGTQPGADPASGSGTASD
ncbi:conjugal transfer protein TraD, partial [Acinetobacter baumannii]